LTAILMRPLLVLPNWAAGTVVRPAKPPIVSVRRVRPPSVEKLTTTSSGSPSASAAFQRIATLPAEPSVVPGLGLSSFTVGG
jgi:hypothetical protein